MKQYDKVWVPSEDPTDYEVCRIESGNPLKGWVESEENVILLTGDDLWEIWAECAHKQVDSETRLKNIENFNAYFKSKGITI